MLLRFGQKTSCVQEVTFAVWSRCHLGGLTVLRRACFAVGVEVRNEVAAELAAVTYFETSHLISSQDYSSPKDLRTSQLASTPRTIVIQDTTETKKTQPAMRMTARDFHARGAMVRTPRKAIKTG